jgi:hypothetical protein
MSDKNNQSGEIYEAICTSYFFIYTFTLLFFADDKKSPDHIKHMTMKKIILTAVTVLFCIVQVPLRAQTSPCYITTGIPFTWDSLTSPTLVTLNDDQYTTAINIGFPFCFFGTYYSQLLIGSNGVISFDISLAFNYCNWPITQSLPSPTPADRRNAIMFPVQDLLPPAGGTIKYQTLGAAPYRRFVVQFDSIAMFSCTFTKFSGQATLYESTNDIETHILNKSLCTTWNNGAPFMEYKTAQARLPLSFPEEILPLNG